MNRVELIEHMQTHGALESIVPQAAYIAMSEAYVSGLIRSRAVGMGRLGAFVLTGGPRVWSVVLKSAASQSPQACTEGRRRAAEHLVEKKIGRATADANKVLDGFVEAVLAGLGTGKPVALTGVGSFVVKHDHEDRPHIEGIGHVGFDCSDTWRDALRKGFGG